MTKAELVAKVARRTGSSQAKTARAIDHSLAELQELLKRGGSIAFTDFGTFGVTRRARRRGRNPQTGQEMVIPSQKVATFRAGKGLRAAVAGKK